MTDAALRKRLQRVGALRAGKRSRSAAATPAVPAAADFDSADPRPIEALLPGREVETEAGPFFLIDERYSLDFEHGPFQLADLHQTSSQVAAELARAAPQRLSDWARIAFIDTETTGLAGGVGTLAFVVGVGVFDGDHFHLQQFFLRDPSEEFGMLQALAELLDSCTAAVSFNGRAFDIPLLESRFLLARSPFDIRALAQLDLLPPARRLWRGRLENCSLGALEQSILGITRTAADVPGWRIPQLYSEYLQSGDAREMQRVLYHNAIDILSMVSLATYLIQAYDDPLADSRSGADCLRIALWFEARREPARAEQAFKAALTRPLDDESLALALQRFGGFLKRRDRREEAAPLWEQLIELAPADPRPYIELAKFYEWHAREIPSALDWTERALAAVGQWAASWRRDEMEAALCHRRARLERKRGRAESHA